MLKLILTRKKTSARRILRKFISKKSHSFTIEMTCKIRRKIGLKYDFIC